MSLVQSARNWWQAATTLTVAFVLIALLYAMGGDLEEVRGDDDDV